MNDEINKINDYWNAANYLSACQLYLLDNPLLKRPLEDKDVKSKIVGHWGTVPGQNFIYVHLNRIIKKNNLNMIYLSGPGHGGNAMIANTYLEGTYTKYYPEITEDEEGLKKLFKRFSFPKGVSSHVSPEVPGSIHEGGELGYSLSHAFGAVLDNPSLIAACVVGDGEAETGPLATSWHFNKFLNREKDGIVLPILHLNGYKIASPTVLGRMADKDLMAYFYSLNYHPYFVEGNDPLKMHEQMINTLDNIMSEINLIKNGIVPYRLPLVILRTPKGWTCPKEYNGEYIENSFRAHQVPIAMDERSKAIPVLEAWLKSYHPENLFDSTGRLRSDLKSLVPENTMGDNPNANGGLLYQALNLPNPLDYAVNIERGKSKCQDMKELGRFLKDVYKNNNNFRIFGPDEALSNRLNYVFENEKRSWNMTINEGDELLANDGRVMDSYLSEHLCEGALEGYILTGRHGIFHSYEAFARIIDSMAGQHAKWLKMCSELSWRKDISSLNIILTSHVWQQDHNGYTHQDPGFISHMANKKDEITAVYLPIDSNMLITCMNEALKTKNKINVIVASKHPSLQWLSMEEAQNLFKKKAGILDFASTHIDKEPDIVMACCGDTPTLETLAAVSLLKKCFPSLGIRVVNVVNLMCLKPEDDETLSDEEYDNLFTTSKPIIFNFHGYAGLIESLTYKRKNHNLSVHGYDEEGTITTSFDMRVQNKIDRYNIILDALRFIDDPNKEACQRYCEAMLERHNAYIKEYGIDMPEVTNFIWE